MYLVRVLFWSLLGIVSLRAQEPIAWAIGEELGLASSEVYELHQDRRGYIWVGCAEGLFRFNGKSFKAFRNPRYQGLALSGLKEDRQGRIWCNSFRGQIFYVSGDTLAHYALPKGLGHQSFIQFELDSTDNLWITAQNGIYQVDANTGAYVLHQPKLDAAKISHVFNPVLAPDGSIWCQFNYAWAHKTNDGWNIFPDHPKMLEPGPTAIVFIDDRVYVAKSMANQTSWFILSPKGFQPITVDQQFTPFRLYKVLKVGQGNNYWLLNANGAWPINDNIQTLKIPPLLLGKAVSDLLLDREGNYWVSTLESGLFFVPNPSVCAYGATPNANEWPASKVTALSSDLKENLFVGYKNGEIIAYDPSRNKITPWETNDQSAIERLGYQPYTQTLWAAQGVVRKRPVQGGTWQKMDQNNGCKSFSPFPNGMMGIAASGFFQVLSDGPDTAWANSFGRPSQPSFGASRVWTLRSERTWAAMDNPQNNELWIACNDSLIILKQGGSSTFRMPDHSPLLVRSLVRSDDGTLWVGTLNQGLLSIKDGLLQAHYHRGSGFPDNRIRALLADGPYLWIVAEAAVLRLDWGKGTWTTLNRFDGLPTVQVQDLALVNKQLFLVTAKGLISLNTRSDYDNKVPPKLYFANLSVNERDTALQTTYDLSWRQRSLRFRIDVLAYRSRGNFILQYRLLGQDSNWIALAPGVDEVNFAGLYPGRYVFQARAMNEDGVLSEETLSLPIRIRKPFWLQTWFAVLLCLLLAGGVFAAYRYRVKVLRRRDLLEKELRTSKLVALKAQMNPHFIFNSLNSIQEFVLLNDKRSANMYLSKFASLMRLTLDHSNKDSIPIEEEVSLLGLYLDLEKMRFDGRIETSFEVAEDLQNSGLFLPSMIVQPFVENAFKHGLLHKEGPCNLSLKMTRPYPESLKVVIEDNGVGRAKAASIQLSRNQRHGSFSTGAARTRLALLNQQLSRKIGVEYEDLVDAQNRPCGTRVKLLIPLFNSGGNEE